MEFEAGAAPNRLETMLVEAIEKASPLTFDQDLLDKIAKEHGAGEAVIRGTFIRAIMSGLAIGDLQMFDEAGQPKFERVAKDKERPVQGARPAQLTPFGIRIKPAGSFKSTAERRSAPRLKISGALNLENFRHQDGAALPPLQLSYCDFEEPIELSSARLSSFNLSGSRFSALLASGANFDGSVDLSWCGPRSGKNAQQEKFPFSNEWIFLHKAKSRVKPGEAGNPYPTLATGPDTASKTDDGTDDWSPPEALAKGDTLESCIVLMEGAHIEGKLSLRHSDLVRNKEQLKPSEESEIKLKYALNLASSQVRDSIDLSQAVVVGGMSLVGAEVSEDVWMQGVRAFSYSNEPCINLQLAKIFGLLGITYCQSCKTDPHSSREKFAIPIVVGDVIGIGLQAREVWMGEGLFLARFVGLPKANVQQSITIGSYRDTGDADRCTSVSAVIDVTNVDVGKNVEFNNIKPFECNDFLESGYMKEFLEFGKPLDLEIRASAANISRHFTISSCSIGPAGKALISPRKSVSLEKATIGTGLQIDAASKVRGEIDLQSADFGRSVSIASLEIRNPSRQGQLGTAINLRNASVNGEVTITQNPPLGRRLDARLIEGRIDLSQAKVTGAIELDQLQFGISSRAVQGRFARSVLGDDTSRSLISLKDCDCSGELRVRGLKMHRIESTHEHRPKIAPKKPSFADIDTAKEVRIGQLSFYDEVVLVEAWAKGEVRTWLYDVKNSRQMGELEGKSPVIHECNANLKNDGRLLLDTQQRQIDYLTFFCNFVEGEEGPFTILTSTELLDEEKVAIFPVEDTRISNLQKQVQDTEQDTDGPEKPSQSAQPDLPRQGFEATLLYADGLFRSTFLLHTDTGMVEMLEDQGLRDGIERNPAKGYWKPGRRNEKIIEQPFFSAFPPDTQSKLQATLAFYVTELNGQFKVSKTPEPDIKFLGTLEPVDEYRGYFDYFGDLSEIEDEEALAGASFAINVDLRGLSCGLMNDAAGIDWNLPDFALLRAEGIKCERVESTPLKGRKQRTAAARKTASEATSPSDRKLSGTDGDFANTITGSETSRDGTREGRLGWLRLQRRLRTPGTELSPTGRWWQEIGFQRRFKWARDRDFVPQTYDEFATNYLRAGESGIGRGILKRKKDIESSIRFWSLYKQFWKARPEREGIARFFGGTRPPAYNLIVVGVLFGVLGFLTPFMRQGFFDFQNWFFALGAAFLVAAIIPFLEAMVTNIFRSGFEYGLSPKRALITFGLFIALGWTGTHWARTGHPLDPTTDWASLNTSAGLDDSVALVLDVAYEPTDVVDRTAEYRNQGRAVYAEPTPCNLGVSSLLYAMDVFIPLLDLDQRKRCTVRETSELTKKSYFGWRLAKTIYEILGWIITSLLILTISGAMRRDLER